MSRTKRWGRAGLVVVVLLVLAGCNPAGLTMTGTAYLSPSADAVGWVEIQVREVQAPPVVISTVDPDVALDVVVYVFQASGASAPVECLADGPGGADHPVACDRVDNGGSGIDLVFAPSRVMVSGGTSTGWKRFVKLPSRLGFSVRSADNRTLAIDVRVVDDAGNPVGNLWTKGVAPALS